MVVKKKGKYDDQPLFIYFVNCGFTRKEIFDLIDKTINYFPADRRMWEEDVINEIKSKSDIEILNEYEPKDKNAFGAYKRWLELTYKKDYISLNRKESGELEKFKPVSNEYSRKYLSEEIRNIVIFISCLKASILHLEKILNDLVSSEKPDNPLFSNIVDTLENYSSVETVFSPDDNSYLRKEKSCGIVSIVRVDGAETGLPKDAYHFFSLVLENAIYNDFTEFLCTPRWQNLKRCRECEKFFVAKTNRIQFFCCDKCRYAYDNRQKIKSGERAAYMKKQRAEGKYQ